MQTKRIYQVQHWPNGEWDRRHNWQKVEASTEKEAAEKVCGLSLRQEGRLLSFVPACCASAISGSAVPPTFM